jgi:hypothetical protein
LRTAHVVALGVVAALLLSSATTLLDEDRQALSQPTFAKVRASVERHPLDYYAYAVGAELLERGRDQRRSLRT